MLFYKVRFKYDFVQSGLVIRQNKDYLCAVRPTGYKFILIDDSLRNPHNNYDLSVEEIKFLLLMFPKSKCFGISADKVTEGEYALTPFTFKRAFKEFDEYS